jgi:hypothetical protein
LEEYLPEFQAGTHRFVVFQKMSGGIDAKADRLVTSIATLGDMKIGYASMNELVQSVVDGKAEMTKIPSLPVIKTRTKKLEEEERAKRQRKQQRSAPESSSQSTSSFETNDGSSQGRKAERERRRAEHYKEHNVREKTPEEIQEMERKRRIRMEEEAARWNMAPEDAPEEGEPIGDEYIDTEDDGEYVQEEKKDDDEDEDVLDLD